MAYPRHAPGEDHAAIVPSKYHHARASIADGGISIGEGVKRIAWHMEEGEPGGGAAIAEDAMSRFSLDASAGGRHSTLLDEYERLAFEAQLNRAIVLRRCYSEPSPIRVVQPQPQQKPEGDDARAPPAPRGAGDQGPGEAARRRDEGGGRFWRLHEVLARLLEALRPMVRWLRNAWERRRRRKEPATVPRVQLLDYLRY